MPGRFEAWLEDPFLARLWNDVRAAGPLRSVAVDLTHACNIRCHGCYFFAEGLDRHGRDAPAPDLDAFIARERARGTNFVTVVGGEPSLALDRLKKLYDAFRLSVATNGLERIPAAGFEDLPIGVSVWGDSATDRELRGGGRLDVFARGLRNYRGDPRAFFYYTVTPGGAAEVGEVVDRCVANGNRVLFSFYGDVSGAGGALDHRQGFDAALETIDAAIERHPGRILMTSWFAEVVATGRLDGERWGRETCTSISSDNPVNAARIRNGRPFDPHFRAYNADLATTRRCCTGETRSCESCFDTWEHFSWVMLGARRRLRTRAAFTRWLTTWWLFYFVNRLAGTADGASLLPEIHSRTRRSPGPVPFNTVPGTVLNPHGADG